MARKPNSMRKGMKVASTTKKKVNSPIPKDVNTKYKVASKKKKRLSA